MRLSKKQPKKKKKSKKGLEMWLKWVESLPSKCKACFKKKLKSRITGRLCLSIAGVPCSNQGPAKSKMHQSGPFKGVPGRAHLQRGQTRW
jgi:hypothetical protein